MKVKPIKDTIMGTCACVNLMQTYNNHILHNPCAYGNGMMADKIFNQISCNNKQLKRYKVSSVNELKIYIKSVD